MATGPGFSLYSCLNGKAACGVDSEERAVMAAMSSCSVMASLKVQPENSSVEVEILHSVFSEVHKHAHAWWHTRKSHC